MDIYLNDFRVPILPGEINVSSSKNNASINLENIGEVSFEGLFNLDTISFSSIFPSQYYNFNSYIDVPSPMDCVNRIKQMWSSNPVRLIIPDLHLNKLFTIEEFTYGYRDGTKDISYDISFKEYKVVSQNIYEIKTKTNVASVKSRVVNKPSPSGKKYLIKPGDTLIGIAKRFYGDSSKYKEIARKNNIKNPNLIYSGRTLIL